MAIPFQRSMRSLEADSFRPTWWMLSSAALLLAAWLGWFLFARVGLYEVTPQARIEVSAAAHAVAAPVAGRVLASRLELGKRVEVGEVLVELEAGSEMLELQGEQALGRSLDEQVAQIRREIDSEEGALSRSEEAAKLQLGEARSEYREAQASANVAAEELKRTQLLFNEGLRSEVDLLTAKAEVEKTEAVAERRRLAIARLDEELETERRDRRSRIERLGRDASELMGSIESAAATTERLGLEVEKRVIRAPVGGTLGDVANLGAGTFVAEGTALCSVVPDGDPQIVAEFEASQAVGRIRSGQEAQLRLDGYPWTEFGTVHGTVRRVASEVRDGSVRVELDIEPDPTSRIPLEHGLPGALEVAVERVTPAGLVLRTVGKWVSTDSAAATRP